MKWLIFICYIMFVYGISIIFTQGIGPFNIFVKIRVIADKISPNVGFLFKCMLCFPTNVGIVFSLVNWFLIPVSISPFNMILYDYCGGAWYFGLLAAIMDGCLSGGVCRFLRIIEDYIDKNTPIFEDDQ